MSLLENVTKNFAAQETSVLKISAQRATKLLQLWLCKATVIRASKKHDPAARIHFFFVSFFSLYMIERLIHPLLSGWFSLLGEVNSRNIVLECRKFRTYSKTPSL